MAFAVKVDIALIDSITGGLKKIDRQLLKTAKTAQITGEKFSKAGKAMNNWGKNLSLKVTAPITALGFASVRAFGMQAEAIAQVEAGLAATGGTAGFTSKQLQQMASDLQTVSVFGDEEILQGVTSQLLTFTNIAGDSFSRTQQAVLDLASKVKGVGLESGAIMLGKALNDPIANLGALSRSGIQFSEDQKEVVKSLAESGRLAEAQSIILDELDKQDGGAAEAAASAGLGPFKQLNNILGDMLEPFGKIVAEALIPFTEKIKVLANRIDNLSPRWKKVIAAAFVFLGVIGPLVLTIGQFALGIGSLLTILPIMASVISSTVIPAIISMTAALAPALLVIGKFILIGAAVAAVAWGISKGFQFIAKVTKKVFPVILGWIDSMLERLSAFSPILGMIAKGFRDIIVEGVKNVIKGVQVLSGVIDSLLEKIGFGDTAVNVTQTRESPIENINQQDIKVENVINNEDGKTKSTETRVNGVIVAAKTINRGSLMPSSVFS